MGPDRENGKMADSLVKATRRGVKRKKRAKAGLAGNSRKRSRVGLAVSERIRPIAPGGEIARSPRLGLEGLGLEGGGRMAPLV